MRFFRMYQFVMNLNFVQVFIPVFGDQFSNAKEAERLGIGISIPFQEISEKNLFEAIQSVVYEPRYKLKAAEIGTIAVDQLEHPLQRAAWWLEHIMKYPQQYIRRSPAHKLTWFQYYCVDVALAIAFGLFMLLLSINKLFKLCRGSNKQKDKRE